MPHRRSEAGSGAGLAAGPPDRNRRRPLTAPSLAVALTTLVALVAPAAPGAAAPAPAPGADSGPVVVYLVRHAEKAAGGTRDPELTAAGRRRARALAAMLADAGVTHLLSTPYRRTRQTLAPLARATGLAVETLETAETAPWLGRLGALPPGSVAVVAGHSNTIPALVRGLAPASPAAPAGDLPEDAYDRLFVVVAGGAPDAAPVALALRWPPLAAGP